MKDTTLCYHVAQRKELPSIASIVTEFRCGWEQARRVHDALTPVIQPPTIPGVPSIPVLEWHGCYGQQWSGHITKESFKHPAKYSRLLIQRILRHGLEHGYWKRGDVIGDPFGGVGTGGIEATDMGLRWIGNELEPKFVACALENFAMHAPRWQKTGRPLPQILQGDSRRFDEIVRDAMHIVSTPPFTMTPGGAQGINIHGYTGTKGGGDPKNLGNRHYQGAGGDREEGNIELLAPGDIDGAIASPPYATIAAGSGGLNHLPAKDAGQQSGRSSGGSQDADSRYGNEPGQISRLKDEPLDGVVTSPVYGGARIAAGGSNEENMRRDTTDAAYSDTRENIDNCPTGTVDGTITSPPYADTMSPAAGGADTPHPDGHTRSLAGVGERYGGTEGNIGNAPAAPLDATVTSPPWEENTEGGFGKHKMDPDKAMSAKRGNGSSDEARRAQLERDSEKTYGESPGQIGKLKGNDADWDSAHQFIAERRAKRERETYWQAMAKVYAAVFRALKPGGYCAIVVKDYVRHKKRVHLCDDTLRLLCFVGFQPIERAHAMLERDVAHHVGDLLGDVGEADGIRATVAERRKITTKSFFRRVHEAKPDAVKIDWEEVLFVRKPL